MASYELLILDSYSSRGRRVIKAWGKKLGVQPTSEYKGNADVLMLWGWGGKVQQQAIAEQKAKGGRVVSVDIGYFGRDRGSVRFSIDGNHPQHLMTYRDEPSRWEALGISLEDIGDAEGHIVLAGLGPKSRTLYGYTPMEWERDTLGRINDAYPGVPVVYRPKPGHDERLHGTLCGFAGTIRDHLSGARLCVAHHSNVSADCAVLGVPCSVVDGAGAFLYGQEISGDGCHPDRHKRLDFLRRLAWFNWFHGEEAQMLSFVNFLIEATA